MKSGYIHVCFIIDESGSMSGSESDVINGFNDLIEKQKNVTDGDCSISLYKFNSNVTEVFVGKNINNVSLMKYPNINCAADIFEYWKSASTSPDIYYPSGGTAMNDAIGTAIYNIGVWLNAMSEEERPSKNLIVIMTDGEENSSTKYSLSKVKDMIKEQTDKYSWDFMYIGADVMDATDADNLGVKYTGFNSKQNYVKNYEVINKATSTFRSTNSAELMDACVAADIDSMNNEYTKLTGFEHT